jgi:hypothetical protein
MSPVSTDLKLPSVFQIPPLHGEDEALRWPWGHSRMFWVATVCLMYLEDVRFCWCNDTVETLDLMMKLRNTVKTQILLEF